jgi:hypothetical protein
LPDDSVAGWNRYRPARWIERASQDCITGTVNLSRNGFLQITRETTVTGANGDAPTNRSVRPSAGLNYANEIEGRKLWASKCRRKPQRKQSSFAHRFDERSRKFTTLLDTFSFGEDCRSKVLGGLQKNGQPPVRAGWLAWFYPWIMCVLRALPRLKQGLYHVA